MPRFVIDEDMPRSTGRALARQGYVVMDVRDHGLRGASDLDIFDFAKGKEAVLVTADLGFGNILQFPLGGHFGIVIVRFPNDMPFQRISEQLVERLKHFAEEDYRGNLIVIEPGKMRIRRGK